MIWYTADLHLGHRFVSELRGFSNVEDHDNSIIEEWNSRVGNDDIVYVLGDLAVSSPVRGIEIIGSLPGRKRLIAGNHDYCHPMHRRSERWTARYMNAFESVAPFGRRKINGVNVLLSHFPYNADRETARYMQWRLPNYGELLLHGHTHAKLINTSALELHVGWDAWSTIVDSRSVEAWVDNQVGSVVG